MVINKLLTVSKAIDDDEITISTIETTASDHKHALKSVQRIQQESSHRYGELTAAQYLDSRDMNDLVEKMKLTQAAPPRIPKQVVLLEIIIITGFLMKLSIH